MHKRSFIPASASLAAVMLTSCTINITGPVKGIDVGVTGVNGHVDANVHSGPAMPAIGSTTPANAALTPSPSSDAAASDAPAQSWSAPDLSQWRHTGMNVSYNVFGTITGCGPGVLPGESRDPVLLDPLMPEDFNNYASLGKYKVSNGEIVFVPVPHTRASIFPLSAWRRTGMNVRYNVFGTITGWGYGILPGETSDPVLLDPMMPEDFNSYASLGKYKVSNGEIVFVPVPHTRASVFPLSTWRRTGMNVRYNVFGTITGWGIEVLPGQSSDPVLLDPLMPEDFNSYASLGKYKVENGTIIPVPGWQ